MADRYASQDLPNLSGAGEFTLLQIKNMPDLFRVAFNLIMLLFFLEVFFRYGKTFDKLSLTQRNRIINKWRVSKVGLCRDFVRFFETFVLFERVSASRGAE